MIEDRDIELLIRAKKDRLAINVLSFLSATALCILVFLKVTQITDAYTIALATISAVLMASSAGANKYVSVSREDLVSTLEGIISRNPEALEKLANLRAK